MSDSLEASMMKRIGELKAECQARQAENSVLAAENARLKAEVERLKDVIEEAKDLLGDCKSLETPACNAYALLWKNSPCRVQRGPKP